MDTKTATASTSTAARFARALQAFEASGQVEELAGLFSDDALLRNATAPSEHRGRDGAVEFWERYMATFGTVRSEFSNIIEADGVAALEWSSTGKLAEGSDFEYDGVTVLELDGEKIKRFTAYFDSAAIVPR